MGERFNPSNIDKSFQLFLCTSLKDLNPHITVPIWFDLISLKYACHDYHSKRVLSPGTRDNMLVN